MRKFFWFFMSVFLSSTTVSQGKITGYIIDNQSEKPIQYASVALIDKDSTVVTGSATDSTGFFEIEHSEKGSFILRASFIGYNKYYSEPFKITPNSNKKMGTISIEISGENLNEYTVKEQKSVVQNNIDKKVFNVDKNITTQGGTAVDVLQNIPSVSIDASGNIMFRGSSGVRIHIDGRPSGLMGADPESVLRQIPASQIKSVEVITNPSAKYDPDGVSGIINIVLKKNKKVGTNGGVDLSWGIYDRLNGSANFSIRNEKINFYTNYNVNLYNGFRNFKQIREQFAEDTSNFLNQEREGTHYWLNQNLNIGSDFYLTDEDQLGVSINGYYNKERRTGDMYYFLLDNSKDTLDIWNRESNDPETKKGGGANVNYEHKFKQDKHKISAELNATYNEGEAYGRYDNYNVVNGDQLKNPYYQQDTYTFSKNTLYLGRVDYALPFGKNMLLETGVKAILEEQRRDFNSDSWTDSTNTFTNDVGLTNDFSFSQDVYSWYGTWSHTIKSFSYKAGIRLEQAQMKSRLFTNEEEYVNNYFSFFPSAHIAKKFGDNHELKLSYSRRIKRPSIWNVNPFPRYSDPYNIRIGNPNLDPEYINSGEFGYGFYGDATTITATAYYRYTNDMIRRVRLVTDEGVNETTFRNLDVRYSYGLELVATYNPWEWWRMNISGNAFQTQIRDDEPINNFNNEGFNYRINAISTMTFWEDFEIQLSGYYRGPYIIPQGELEPFGSLDIAIQKGLFKGKGSVGLKVSDVFNTKVYNLNFSDVNFTQKTQWKQETRFFYVTFSYRFGKTKDEGKGNKK